jgi:hypothetical protein
MVEGQKKRLDRAAGWGRAVDASGGKERLASWLATLAIDPANTDNAPGTVPDLGRS